MLHRRHGGREAEKLGGGEGRRQEGGKLSAPGGMKIENRIKVLIQNSV